MATQDLKDILEAATAFLRNASHQQQLSPVRPLNYEVQRHSKIWKLDCVCKWEEEMEALAGAGAFSN